MMTDVSTIEPLLRAMPAAVFIATDGALAPMNPAAEALLADESEDLAPARPPDLERLLDRAEPSFEFAWGRRDLRVRTWPLPDGRRGVMVAAAGRPPPRPDDALWADMVRRSPAPAVFARLTPGDVRASPIIAANHGARVYGCRTARDPVSRPLAEFLEPWFDGSAWKSLEALTVSPHRVHAFRAGGDRLPVRIRACFDGHRLGVVLEDIAYEVRLERSLAQLAEALSAHRRDQAELGRDMAERIQGPIEILTRCVEARMQAAAWPEVGELTGACLALTRALDGLGGSDDITACPVALSGVVGHLLDDLAEELEAARAKVTMGRLPVVWGLEADLDLVLRTLLRHAIETDGVGSGACRLHIGASATRVGWRIAIHCDAGPAGPDAEVSSALAVGLRQAVIGGGLPLARCRRIIQQHGGRMGVFADGDSRAIWFEWPGQARTTTAPPPPAPITDSMS